MKRRTKQPYYPTNERIRGSEFRVINSDGENLGVISREEAMGKAAEQELDLVLIGPNASPPVVKITEYSKFKYEKEKQAAKGRKRKSSELKQLRFKPNIDDHDLAVRVKKARDFLKHGDTVKFSVPFYGRTIVRKDIGYEKLDRVWKEIEDLAEIEKNKWMDKRFLMMVVRPKK